MVPRVKKTMKAAGKNKNRLRLAAAKEEGAKTTAAARVVPHAHQTMRAARKNKPKTKAVKTVARVVPNANQTIIAVRSNRKTKAPNLLVSHVRKTMTVAGRNKKTKAARLPSRVRKTMTVAGSNWNKTPRMEGVPLLLHVTVRTHNAKQRNLLATHPKILSVRTKTKMI